jgi:hypothetical protein
MDGGGQLTAVLVPAGTEAADAAVLTPPVAGAGGPPGAAGRVPLRHDGSLHCRADAATGGTPRMQSGSVQPLTAATAGGGPPLHFGEPLQALAAVAVRPSEPAVRAAEIIAPPPPGRQRSSACPASVRFQCS